MKTIVLESIGTGLVGHTIYPMFVDNKLDLDSPTDVLENDPICFDSEGLLSDMSIQDRVLFYNGLRSDENDLFEYPHLLPLGVQAILDKASEMVESGEFETAVSQWILPRLEQCGWTADIGMDGMVYDLRPILCDQLVLLEKIMNKYDDPNNVGYFRGVVDGVNHSWKALQNIYDDYMDGIK